MRSPDCIYKHKNTPCTQSGDGTSLIPRCLVTVSINTKTPQNICVYIYIVLCFCDHLEGMYHSMSAGSGGSSSSSTPSNRCDMRVCNEQQCKTQLSKACATQTAPWYNQCTCVPDICVHVWSNQRTCETITARSSQCTCGTISPRQSTHSGSAWAGWLQTSLGVNLFGTCTKIKFSAPGDFVSFYAFGTFL